MLLVGGVIGTWSAHEAIVDDAAHAVDEPPPGIVVGLLHDARAVVDDVLPPASPAGPATVDRGLAGTDVVREPAHVTRGNAGTSRPVHGEPDPAARVPRGDLPAAVAPVRRVVDRVSGAGVAEAVEAVEPVTRPVVGAVAPVTRPVVGAAAPVTRPVAGITAPVVQEIIGTGLLEPVDAVVRPVASPIVETLAPVLAPVLGVTGPILGAPAGPAAPPGEPVDPLPGPGVAVPDTTAPVTTVPVTTTTGATERPVRASAATPTYPDAVPPRRDVAAGRWSGGESAVGAAADVTRDLGYVGGTGASRCDTFVDWSPQPDTTPA
jgi:hypothetical protein